MEHHTINTPENQDSNWADGIDTLVWDQDNTTSDFLEFAVPAYEAMSATIAEATGIPEETVANTMQKIYFRHRTIEYEGVVQEMAQTGFFDNIENLKSDGKIDPKKIGALALKAQKIFSQVRAKHLRPYPGIQQAFRKSKKEGFTNIILTDATSFQAKKRADYTKIGEYIDTIFARKKDPTPNLDQSFKDREARGEYDVPFRVIEIDEEKPHTRLDQILKMTREEISRRVCIIGDNDDRDMELSRLWNCRGIFAVYGLHDKDSDLTKRIARFSPHSILARNASIVTKSRPGRNKNNSLIKIAKTPADIEKILNIE